MTQTMTQTPDSWKRISSNEIADCRVFRVREDVCVRDSDEKEATFFVIENPNWVNIIATTKDNEVILIEQFRHGTAEIILEIPGGMIDEGEEPEAAAKRELLEETGFSSQNWVLLGKSDPNPAIQNNTVYHYLARDCAKTADTSFDQHESIATKLISLSSVENLIATGKITHSLVLAAFYYLGLRK